VGLGKGMSWGGGGGLRGKREGERVEREEGGREEEEELDTCHDCIHVLWFRTHPRYGVGLGLAHKVGSVRALPLLERLQLA